MEKTFDFVFAFMCVLDRNKVNNFMLLLAVMTLLTPSTIRKYRTTFILTAIILCVFLSSYFISIYDSIFVDTEIGGSSSDMREGQWEIAFYYMMNDFG